MKELGARKKGHQQDTDSGGSEVEGATQHWVNLKIIPVHGEVHRLGDEEEGKINRR